MTKHKLTRHQFFILTSVLCAIFLAALDQTIVATAAPKIVSDLHDFEAIAWIFSSYMLASTVMIPIYGKLSDIYGRRTFYLGGIIVFLIGSILCGVAFSMPWLIAARAVQGLGAGAIMVESFTIIGDLFPPIERGKWQGAISGMFGLASIIGPVLGGFLSDYASWRWIFFLNLPIGLVALIMTHYHFPALLTKGVKQRINYGGVVLLSSGLLALLFGLVRTEKHHNWLAPDVIALFSLSLVLLAIFKYIDKRSEDPIFPAELFQNKVFSLSIISIFLGAISMFGAISFIPLFTQMALGQTASNSGLILIPYVLALTIASTLTGQIVSRTGKYKAMMLSGTLITSVGMFLLARMDVNTSTTYLTLGMVLLGIGMGNNMPIFIVIVQSSFGHDKLGLVTSSMQLFRNIGATLGTALLGALIINKTEKNLLTISPRDFGSAPLTLSDLPQIFHKMQSLPENAAMLTELRGTFANAISGAFLLCTLLCLMVIIAVAFLPVIKLRKSN